MFGKEKFILGFANVEEGELIKLSATNWALCLEDHFSFCKRIYFGLRLFGKIVTRSGSRDRNAKKVQFRKFS